MVFTLKHEPISLMKSIYVRGRIPVSYTHLDVYKRQPVFHAYYEKKRGEGKHHLVATNAVARKLCHTIFAILKNNTPYEIKQ